MDFLEFIGVMDHSSYKRIDAAVKLAIKNIIEHGMDDIFRRPIFSDSYEHRIIKENKDKFEKKAQSQAVAFLKSANLVRERIGNIHHCLVPKDINSYRNVHWIDPFDVVKYLALAIVLSDDIEKSRIPSGDRVVHSHRRSIDKDQLFNRDFGYKSFRERSGEISRSMIGCWKVVTDISVFFDRIGNHHLENHLLDLGCEKRYVELLREILLLWAGDRRSHGIPVGCDGSRIISEAALISIDRKMTEYKINYVRYVDDFRIFARTRSEAYEHLRVLSELLMDEGLHLNHKKTFVEKIVSDDIYRFVDEDKITDEHQRIDENEKISKTISVRVSGRSTISRRYVEPGKEAIRTLKRISKNDIKKQYLDASAGDKQEKLRLVVKYFIYADQDSDLILMVLESQITSIIYVVDALTKEHDRIVDEVRNELKIKIFEVMGGLECGYPFNICLIKLFSSTGFEDSRSINHVVDNAKWMDNQLFLREAIFIGFQQLDRMRIRRLAMSVFRTVPPPTQRAIYFALTRYKKMSDDERRPLVKNIRNMSDDWFINNDNFSTI